MCSWLRVFQKSTHNSSEQLAEQCEALTEGALLHMGERLADAETWAPRAWGALKVLLGQVVMEVVPLPEPRLDTTKKV